MFKSLGLQSKIVISILTVSVIVITLLAINSYLHYQTQYKETANEIAHKLQFDMQRSIQKKLDIGVTNAVSFASNKRLINAVVNNDRTTALDVLGGISDTFKKNTNFKGVKIHIHTPNNHSFLRSWKPKKNGDDLSSFRFGVQKVIDGKKPIAVLELGRAGLAVRGITPLFNGSEYIGSLEFIQGVGSMAREYKTRDMNYVMLLNDYALSISTKAKKNTPVGDYVLANQSWFTPEAVAMAQNINWSLLNEQGWLIQDNQLITQTQVEDMQGKLVGTQLIGQPLTELITATNIIKNDAIEQISILIGVILIMSISIIFILRSTVIRPVSELQKIMERVTKQGDFSSRMEQSDNQDEIAKLAQDFNALMDSTQQIIKETSDTMQAVRNGQLSQRIKVHTVGDLDDLKQAVNGTADTLEQTMTTLGQALKELGNANFSARINVDDNVKGAFKEALCNAQTTMKTLNSAVSEINTVVS
ncbi:MAG: HAMP domain-containing protein, partial [Pseudomonadota bacterium]|nr:HAMP domain-containing protein [Pseudomonadota bacterium]